MEVRGPASLDPSRADSLRGTQRGLGRAIARPLGFAKCYLHKLSTAPGTKTPSEKECADSSSAHFTTCIAEGCFMDWRQPTSTVSRYGWAC